MSRYRGSLVGTILFNSGNYSLLAVKFPTKSYSDLNFINSQIESNNGILNIAIDALAALSNIGIENSTILLDSQLPNGTPQTSPFATLGSIDWTWEILSKGGNWGLENTRVPQIWNLNPYARIKTPIGQASRTGILDFGFKNDSGVYHSDSSIVSTVDTAMDLQLTLLQRKNVSYHGFHVSGIINSKRNTVAESLGTEGVDQTSGRLFARGLTSVTNSWPSYFGIYGNIAKLQQDNGIGNIRFLNLSLGFLQYGAPIPNSNLINCRDRSTQDFLNMLRRLAVSFKQTIEMWPNLLVFAAAGNDSNLDGASALSGINCSGVQGYLRDYPAKLASPFNYLAIEMVHPQVISVEANDIGKNRANFSNLGTIDTTLIAPGVDILSTYRPDKFLYDSGTSMATPHVTGLASVLLNLDPTLTNAEVRKLLFDNAKADVSGTTQKRIDAFASALGIDVLKGNNAIKKALVDIDDGTRDGNERVEIHSKYDPVTKLPITDQTRWIFNEEEARKNEFGSIGDGKVDMKDFRRFRDWRLESISNKEDYFYQFLDGFKKPDGSFHKKVDLNGDALITTGTALNGDIVVDPAKENIYPRGDFNGNGTMDTNIYTQDTAPVPGLGLPLGTPVTDLEVMKSVWEDTDPNYPKEKLDEMLRSIDVHVDLRDCIGQILST